MASRYSKTNSRNRTVRKNQPTHVVRIITLPIFNFRSQNSHQKKIHLHSHIAHSFRNAKGVVRRGAHSLTLITLPVQQNMMTPCGNASRDCSPQNQQDLMKTLKLLQINLDRSEAAMHQLETIAIEQNIDIILPQEPAKSRGCLTTGHDDSYSTERQQC